jgi:hypothetical protein
MRADIVTGVIVGGFGVFVLQQALQLDYANEFGPGSGFIPFWIGFGLLLLALILIGTTVRSPQAAGSGQSSVRETAKVLGSWAALMVSVALLKLVGFFVSLGLLTFFLVYLVDRRSLSTAATVAVATLAGFYLIFTLALGLSVPRGPWGF